MQVTEAEADDIPVGDEDEDKKSSKVIVTGRDGKHDTSKSRLIVDDLRLHYSEQGCHRIPEVLVKMYGSTTQTLDLSFNELVTLKGIEQFPLLRELILDNNQLSDSIVIPYLPYLHTLTLNKNRITDLESFMSKIRHNLPSLTYLSLLGNKACPDQLTDATNDDEDYQRYRYYVLHHVPRLKFLDSRKVEGWEIREAKKRGELMLVVRPKPEQVNQQEREERKPNPYTPLPKSIRSPNDQKGWNTEEERGNTPQMLFIWGRTVIQKTIPHSKTTEYLELRMANANTNILGNTLKATDLSATTICSKTTRITFHFSGGR